MSFKNFAIPQLLFRPWFVGRKRARLHDKLIVADESIDVILNDLEPWFFHRAAAVAERFFFTHQHALRQEFEGFERFS